MEIPTWSSTLGRDNPGLSNPNPNPKIYPNPNPKICQPWVVTTQGWRLGGYFHTCIFIASLKVWTDKTSLQSRFIKSKCLQASYMIVAMATII